jgi:thioredoxin 1
MTDISKLDEATFQNEVIEAAECVLVDFTTVWCAPCKMLDPVVEELANDWEDSVKVFKGVTGYQPKDRLEKKFNPHI